MLLQMSFLVKHPRSVSISVPLNEPRLTSYDSPNHHDAPEKELSLTGKATSSPTRRDRLKKFFFRTETISLLLFSAKPSQCFQPRLSEQKAQEH